MIYHDQQHKLGIIQSQKRTTNATNTKTSDDNGMMKKLVLTKVPTPSLVFGLVLSLKRRVHKYKNGGGTLVLTIVFRKIVTHYALFSPC